MLNRFLDDVVSQGAEALLPQNLENQWLDRLYVASKNFLVTTLKNADKIEEDEFLSDVNSMMMLSAIVEILQHLKNYTPSDGPYSVSEEQMFEYISCYSLAIILECIKRQSAVDIPPATLETIFDRERLFETEKNNPELTELLNTLISE